MSRLDSDRPSVTAWKVALRRAAHQVADRPPVFADPIAIPILGPKGEAYAREPKLAGKGPVARGLRAFMAARSRYAEDRLGANYEAGVRQYVVLGAGLDTFAYRNPWPDLKVFEVDHPATQAWKRDRLREADIAVPDNLTFAPVDFQGQTLADGLAAAGFDAGRPAFVSWLGVIYYLTQEMAFETLGLIAAWPTGSEIVFDFPVARENLDFIGRMALDAVAARVALAGEPFRSSYSPGALSARLGDLGFTETAMLSAPELNALYFDGRADGLKLHGGAARLMRARV